MGDDSYMQALRERVLDPCIPFLPDELDVLEQQPVAHRVEALAADLLYLKVPAERWEAWVRDYERRRGRPLARPFPPADLLRQDDHKQRCETLAPLLGCKPLALTQRRYRQLREWLPKLYSYRELYGC
jgi:hypothetical protein